MISSGEWSKSDVTNYITCDAYNGENTPKRYGLKLRNALELVSMLEIQFLHFNCHLYKGSHSTT